MEAQLVPIPSPVRAIPGRNSSATSELIFPATDIPPLGYLSFHVQQTGNYRFFQQQRSSVRHHKLGGDEPIQLVGEVGNDVCYDVTYLVANVQTLFSNFSTPW